MRIPPEDHLPRPNAPQPEREASPVRVRPDPSISDGNEEECQTPPAQNRESDSEEEKIRRWHRNTTPAEPAEAPRWRSMDERRHREREGEQDMELDQIGYLAMWMGKNTSASGNNGRQDWKQARKREISKNWQSYRKEQTRADKKMMPTLRYERCWTGTVFQATLKTDGWHVRKRRNNCIEDKIFNGNNIDILVQIDTVILEHFDPTVTNVSDGIKVNDDNENSACASN